nr:FmdE family protein [uncultured Desulfobacter sp.]
MPELPMDRQNLFQKCVEFHGHLCPGLAFGFQAAMAGMDFISETRAQDEEIVAIVETDACGTDAIQVITGCTFGKGNFIFKNYGKTAFTFVSRNSGKGVRIAKKYDPEPLLGARHQELIQLIRKNKANEADHDEFWELHRIKAMEILEQAPENIFTITGITVPIPSKAKIEPSHQCDMCKEPTMASKLTQIEGCFFCRGCMADMNRQ